MAAVWKRDGVPGGLPPLLREVDQAGLEDHPDLDAGLGAVCQEVPGLQAQDPGHPQEQVAGGAQRDLDPGLEDEGDGFLEAGLEDVGLGELGLPVGCEPDLPEGGLLGQDTVGVEHAGLDWQAVRLLLRWLDSGLSYIGNMETK